MFVFGSVADATVTTWDSLTGKLTGISPTLITNLHAFLDQAQRHNVYVLLALLDGSTPLAQPQVLTDASSMQSFIDLAVTPIAKALSSHPALFGIEIISEPESMASDFGTPSVLPAVQMADIQRLVGRVAHAIHQVAPNTMVRHPSVLMCNMFQLLHVPT